MHSFQDYTWPAPLHSVISAMKWKEFTPFQKLAIPVAMGHRDLLAVTSGERDQIVSYGVPLLTRLLKNIRNKAVILAPNPDSVFAILDVFMALTESVPDLVPSVVDAEILEEKGLLESRNYFQKSRVFVGTPSDFAQCLKRGVLSLSSVEVLVLHQIDIQSDVEMANLVNEVHRFLPKTRQTLAFLPNPVKEAEQKPYLKLMKDPVRLL